MGRGVCVIGFKGRVVDAPAICKAVDREKLSARICCYAIRCEASVDNSGDHW